MALVPENYLSGMHQHQQHRRVQTNPLVRNLSELDAEMNQILSRQDIADDEKLKLYHQVMQRYLEYDRQRKDRQSVPLKIISNTKQEGTNEAKAPTFSQKEVQIEDEIIDSVPKTIRNKARLLVNKLKQNKEIMFWNDRGELVYDGKPVQGTSIVDLVRDVMGDRKRFQPYNWKMFSRGLARINTPLDWVGNENRKKTLVEYKSKGPNNTDDEDEDELVITPPSTPVKNKRKSKGKTTKTRWINY